jgi:ribulose-5-phosphate 4-epimerase/fuculose-1-phosphate aldolase
MIKHEHRLLRAVAEAVADGLPVDWTGLKARNPSLAEALSRMEAMEEVAGAYRTLRRGAAPSRGGEAGGAGQD